MVTMNYSRTQLSALLIMRLAIGWHFLYEGIAKLMEPNWSAAGFLQQSKWLLSPVFKMMAANPEILKIVNFLNVWGLIIVGLFLIIGLFTRWVSIAGISLVFLYYICNPPFPGLYYTVPTEGSYLIINKNFVEMTALFVVFALPTSQVLGLDFFFKRKKR